MTIYDKHIHALRDDVEIHDRFQWYTNEYGRSFYNMQVAYRYFQIVDASPLSFLHYFYPLSNILRHRPSYIVATANVFIDMEK